MMTMHQYMACLTEINGKLDQFPPNAANQSLPQDKILDIGEFRMPNKWQQEMILHNFDPMEGTVQDLVAFCKCQEHTEDHKGNLEIVKSKMKAKEYKIPKKDRKPSRKWCEVCKMNNHNTSNCNHVKNLREEHEEKY